MSMPISSVAQHGYRVGDAVVAAIDIGVFRPRVRRHTTGVVVAIAPSGEIEIHFANGRVELLHPSRLAAA